jgi:hypothetical protein
MAMCVFAFAWLGLAWPGEFKQLVEEKTHQKEGTLKYIYTCAPSRISMNISSYINFLRV